MPDVSGTKLVDLADLKVVHDIKLDKNISSLIELSSAPSQTDILLVRSSNTNYKTTVSNLLNETRILIVNATISAGSTATISNTAITSDMVPIKLEIGTRSAQSGQWTVTTASGSATITGTINSSTTVKLYLLKIRS